MAEEEILSPDIASITEPEPSPAPQLVISAPAPVPAPVEVPTYSGPTVSPSLVLGDVNAALMRSLNNKTVDWMALLALLLGICAAMCALRVGSRVLKEFGIDACWVKREPLLPMLARRSDHEPAQVEQASPQSKGRSKSPSSKRP